jgi:hypothetical protein
MDKMEFQSLNDAIISAPFIVNNMKTTKNDKKDDKKENKPNLEFYYFYRDNNNKD